MALGSLKARWETVEPSSTVDELSVRLKIYITVLTEFSGQRKQKDNFSVSLRRTVPKL